MFEIILSFWTALQTAAPEAAVKSVITLLSILALRLVKVLPDSKWARAANVVFSVLLSGVTATSVSKEDVLIFTLTSAFSSLLWDGISLLYVKVKSVKPFSPSFG